MEKDDELASLRTQPLAALAKYRTARDANRLAALLTRASDAYYNAGDPLLPDDIFDMAKDRLEALAPKHAFLKQVGAPIGAREKVPLPYWMGSMNKIKDSERDLVKWVAKYPNGTYVWSDKLDGNSAMVVYQNGSVRMYSRGDGTIGQDISHLVPHVQGVPLPSDALPAGLAVRGELILSKDAWDAIRHVGANARNVVAGALHRKTPDPSVASRIEFVAYDMVHPRKARPIEALAQLSALGFRVVHHARLTKEELTPSTLSRILADRRAHSPYECDGIIVAHNEAHRIVKGANPSYAFAFKSILTHDEAEVVVSHVEWKVSKDGYLKPTIFFPPVQVAGVTIQRATGFNGAFIERHVIGPGARIVIIRSGDVIPHVVRVLTPASAGTAQMPAVPYRWTETHVDVLVQEQDGIEQRIRTLQHFVKTLDVPHIAAGTARKLAEAGFDTLPKLMRITKNDLLRIDGFKETSATKVHAAIQDVRARATCVQLMAASNIFGRGLGEKKLQAIAKGLPQILRGELPPLDELKALDGVGPATAKLFHEGLRAFFVLLKEMDMPCRYAAAPRSDPIPTDEPAGPRHKNLAALVVVFTGFRNKAWEEAITAAGGKVTTSVSKNTTHVVAANPSEGGSKIEKARALPHIRILSRDEFASQFGFA
jgi:DNA ligase (NAD+)